MKRKIWHILLLVALCLPAADAQSFAPISRGAETVAQPQQPSLMNGTGRTYHVSEVGASEAPMLGSTAQTPYSSGPRRAPGGGGDVDWGEEHGGSGEGGTDIIQPVGDGMWALLVLTLLYVLSIKSKLKSQKSKVKSL